MTTKRMILATILAVETMAFSAHAMTFYVNQTNTTAVTNGLTMETGWIAISNGVAQMLATNLIAQGGHSLVVGPGTYKEQITLIGGGGGVGGHCGVSTNYNRVTAQGEVIIDGENTTRNGVSFGTAGYLYYMRIDGFKITRCAWGLTGDAAYFHVVSNMTIYACHGGINLTSGNTTLIGNINRCTIVGNDIAGLSSSLGGGMVVSNSIVAFNGIGALELSIYGDIALRNCLLYGNGVPYVDENATVVTGKAAIEALPSTSYPANVSTNLVTDAPGYLNLWPFDVARIRSESPIFTAASDGGCIGALPSNSYTTVSVSALNRAFYVAPTGDDGRDETAAQTASTPWATLGRAAQSVRESDTVRVTPGTYAGGFTLSNACPLGGSIAFLTTGGVAVVNGAGQAAAMTVTGVNGIAFSGFSFTGATHGVAFHGVYQAAFSNCAFADNAQDGINARKGAGNAFYSCDFARNGYRGANLYADSKATCHGFTFTDCNFYSNRPSNSAWGVVDAQAAWFLTLDRCRIFDNDTNVNTSAGINLYAYANGNQAGFFSIRNSAIYRNNRGIYLYYSKPGGIIDNCTIYGNRYEGVVDGSGVNLGWPTILNSVIAGNGTYGNLSTIYGLIFQNCCFKDNATAPYRRTTAPATNLFTVAEINATATANTNNIVPAADLAFRNAAADDFRIGSVSPLFNAGMTNTPWARDLYGNRRLYGPAVDIGCNELIPLKGALIQIR